MPQHKEKVFFIPTRRSMLISDGWAEPFQRLTSDTPVVARIFSQNPHDLFSSRLGNAVRTAVNESNQWALDARVRGSAR